MAVDVLGEAAPVQHVQQLGAVADAQQRGAVVQALVELLFEAHSLARAAVAIGLGVFFLALRLRQEVLATGQEEAVDFVDERFDFRIEVEEKHVCALLDEAQHVLVLSFFGVVDDPFPVL